ncbi:MAG: hypothetical protein AB7G06_05525 [Bdellovibrionales bacterium]
MNMPTPDIRETIASLLGDSNGIVNGNAAHTQLMALNAMCRHTPALYAKAFEALAEVGNAAARQQDYVRENCVQAATLLLNGMETQVRSAMDTQLSVSMATINMFAAMIDMPSMHRALARAWTGGAAVDAYRAMMRPATEQMTAAMRFWTGVPRRPSE